VKRFCAIVLLGSFLSCLALTSDEEEVVLSDTQFSLYFWVLLFSYPVQQDTNATRGCGVNLVGNFLGFNSDPSIFAKLQENQEINSTFLTALSLEFEPKNPSMVAIEILESRNIATTNTVDCSNSNPRIRNQVSIRTCVGRVSQQVPALSNSNLSIGESFSRRLKENTKYWISVSSSERSCAIRIRLRSISE